MKGFVREVDARNILKRDGGFRSRRFVFPARSAKREVTVIARSAGWKVATRRHDGVTWDARPDWGGGLNVRYVEVPAAGCCYVMASTSLTAEVLDSCIAVFAAHPYVLTFDTLLAAMDEDENPEAHGLALVRAGLGAPAQADPRFVTRWEAAARHDNPEVRWGALWGMWFAEWPELRPLLQSAAEHDPSEQLRTVAAAALRTLDQGGAEDF